METQAYLWHYLVAGLVFALLGVVGHVTRAVFNVFPDRLSDKPLMDMMISNGYNLGDYLFCTEYDDAGYYRLDSLRNLRNSVVATLLCGWGVMLFVPGASGLAASAINGSLAWLWQLFLERLNDIRLF
jgi:hypothetical protein